MENTPDTVVIAPQGKRTQPITLRFHYARPGDGVHANTVRTLVRARAQWVRVSEVSEGSEAAQNSVGQRGS